MLILVANFDLSVARDEIPQADRIAIWVAGILCLGLLWGLTVSLLRVFRDGTLTQVNQATTRISAMVCGTVIWSPTLYVGLSWLWR